MKTDGIKQAPRILACVAVLLAIGALSLPAYAQATMADLVRVSRAKGDDYKALRDDLLQRHPQKWDVAAATAHSWEAGVAALALNARLAVPEEIARWEGPREHGANIMGTSPSFISKNRRAAMAWRLEVLWKGADAGLTGEVTRDCGEMFYRNSPLDDVPIDLWKGIWENADNKLLRRVAIHALGCTDDPAAYDTLGRALNDRDQGGIAWAACLRGLRHRNNLDATQLILEAWDSIAKSAGTLESAIAILGRQGTPEGRLKLRSIAMDPKRNPRERAQAIAYRGSNPQAEDAELFIEFLGSDADVRTKQRAFDDAKNWPVDQIRPVVRYVLNNETDPQLLRQAMSTLARCYHRADRQGTATDPETAEDVRLIDAAIERIGSPEGMKRSRDFCVRTIEGYRGPLVGDKWPWERLPNRRD